MRGRLIKAKDVSLRPGKVEAGANALQSLAMLEGGEESPTIRVCKDGELITRIEVGCPCGRQLDFDCQYDDSTAVAGAMPGTAGGTGS